MKLFKNFIIPFILAIIVFSPRFVSASVTNFSNEMSYTNYSSLTFTSSDNLPVTARTMLDTFPFDSYPDYEPFFFYYSSGNVNSYPEMYLIKKSSYLYFGMGSNISLSTFTQAYETSSAYRDNTGFLLISYSSTGFTPPYYYQSFSKYFESRKFYFVNYGPPPPPEYDYSSSHPIGIDVDGFMEWLENEPVFSELIIKSGFFLDLDSLGKIKFLMQYYDDYGMYGESFIYNMDLLRDIRNNESFTTWDALSLRNVLKMQYNKYINSITPPVVEPTYPPYTNNNPVTIPDDTLTQPIIIQNNNDFNYYYLREIIRLITNDINNDYSYHYENKNIFNNIVSGINDINFNLNTNLLPIVTGIANLDANLNLLAPVINSVNDNLTNLITPITNMGDKLNDISLKLDSGGSGNCNYDESFWTMMLVPTFDEFDEIHAEFISKFPIVNEIAIISLDGDIPTIENKLPDKELDNLIEGGLVPVSYASQGGLPSGQNPYGFSYSESEITSSDLFTFTMPTGTNSWLDKFNGMEISFINFKKFNTAIQFFKGIISVLAVFAFTKWLLNFVPKLATGASTGDG